MAVDQVVVGATRKILEVQLTDENGSPISLAGAGVIVRLQGTSPDLPDNPIDVVGSVPDPPNGVCRWITFGSMVTDALLSQYGLTAATYTLRVYYKDTGGLIDYGPTFQVSWLASPVANAVVLYNQARQKIMDGTLDLAADTLKFMLVTASYSPDRDHTNVGQASAFELTGTGYVAGYGNSGRKTLASKTFGVDAARDFAFMDCADPVWTTITAGTVGYILVIKETGGADSASIPIAWIDVPNVATAGGTFTLAVSADGLLIW